MPHTVRRRTCPVSPAASPQNVRNDGAVKHGSSAPSSTVSEAGRVRPGSIGGSPHHEADMHTADASALTPPCHPPRLARRTPLPVFEIRRDTIHPSNHESAKDQACLSREMS